MRENCLKTLCGGTKKICQTTQCDQSTYISVLAYPRVFLCKIAIFKNPDLCSNHIYNVNGVSTCQLL